MNERKSGARDDCWSGPGHTRAKELSPRCGDNSLDAFCLRIWFAYGKL